jgi:hypothetical protein
MKGSGPRGMTIYCVDIDLVSPSKEKVADVAVVHATEQYHGVPEHYIFAVSLVRRVIARSGISALDHMVK